MKILKPHYYDEFSCVGGNCPDTCCAGWKIYVDKEILEIYNNIPGEFGEKLRNSIKTDKKTSFILDQNLCCPFLNKEKLCDIYINIGSDKLCDTCKIYPRIILRYDDIYEYNLTLSCPEVARILVSCKDAIDFCFGEEEIGNELVDDAKNDYLFNALIRARGISVDLMQKREITLWKRIFLCVSIAEKFKNSVEQKEFNNLVNVLEPFENIDYIYSYINMLDSLPVNKLLQREQYNELINAVAKLGLNNKKFNEYLKEVIIYFNNSEEHLEIDEILKIYNDENYQDDYIYENYMVYHLFRYYMTAYKDKNLYEYIYLMVEGYALIRLFAAVHWFNNNKKIGLKDYEEILYSYSRTIEHSFDRIEEIYHRMEERGYHTLACVSILIH